MDATHLATLSENEENIQHMGLRGRFRELLIDNLLSPWLPPYAACGTGMVVDVKDHVRESTQDDIIIFDKSLVPSVLASTGAPDGVFPLDGVLARIEVKSTLTRSALKDAIVAANEINKMEFAGSSPGVFPLPINLVFAYKSDLKGNSIDELYRMLDLSKELGLHYSGACPELPSPISGLCVCNRGFWAYGNSDTIKTTSYLEAIIQQPYDELVMFVGAVSNSCFNNHIARQGRDPQKAVEGGIGRYILDKTCYQVATIPST